MPSRPEGLSPSGPLFSVVGAAGRGRAVSRPSWPGLDCAEPMQLFNANEAMALPAVATNCRRVISMMQRYFLRLLLFVEKRKDLVDVEPAGAGVRPAGHLEVLVLHAELLHLRHPLPGDFWIDRGVRIALDDHYRQALCAGDRVGRDVVGWRHRVQGCPRIGIL